MHTSTLCKLSASSHGTQMAVPVTAWPGHTQPCSQAAPPHRNLPDLVRDGLCVATAHLLTRPLLSPSLATLQSFTWHEDMVPVQCCEDGEGSWPRRRAGRPAKRVSLVYCLYRMRAVGSSRKSPCSC